MGTLTAGNIKAGTLESSDSPASNTYVSFANSTVTTYESTAYTAGGQEIETFDFTENGLQPGEGFIYEKSGAGKLQGYPGLCIVSDQVNGSQVFEDRGPSKHPITVGNETHHDTGGGVKLYNPTAIYFDGTDDYLTVPNHADFYMGTGDFTIDYWFRPANLTGDQQVFDHNYRLYDEWYSGNWLVKLHDDANNEWQIQISSHGLAVNTWHHIAYVRAGRRWMAFFNGKLRGELDVGAANLDSTGGGVFNIGRKNDGARDYQGYLDYFRIINGKALYTHDFSPPSRSPKGTEAYGNVADYTKITMMGYRLDNSTYFTAINYVAGDEVVAQDYMGIGYNDLSITAYSGNTQKSMIYNKLTETIKFTAYVETTT